MISSQDLSELCTPNELRKRMISLAILDAVMSPEWQYRYYSYDPRWRKDVTLASMRNGSGEQFRPFSQKHRKQVSSADHDQRRQRQRYGQGDDQRQRRCHD